MRVVGRRVDARLDRVQLDCEVVAEQLGEVVRTDVVRRVDTPRLHVLAVLVVEVVVDGEQQPSGAHRVEQCPHGASPAALGSAGYCIDTRSNEQAGNGVCRASPQTHSTAAPARSAASRARPMATSEMSIAVTVQPLRASQIASAPSPQPTSSARPGVRPADLDEEPPVRAPAPLRTLALAVPRVPLGGLRRGVETLLAVFVLMHVPQGRPSSQRAGSGHARSPLVQDPILRGWVEERSGTANYRGTPWSTACGSLPGSDLPTP